MPSGWVHAAIDLIVYGRPYFDLHKEKDKYYKTLGLNHRKKEHKWYLAFGEDWTFDDPFPIFLRDSILKICQTSDPNKAEEQMAYTDHDYFDKIWDDLSEEERSYWEGFFTRVILRPEILVGWAGVDVLEGRIQRIINGKEVWENCPRLKSEYERLRRYVEAVDRERREL